MINIEDNDKKELVHPTTLTKNDTFIGDVDNCPGHNVTDGKFLVIAVDDEDEMKDEYEWMACHLTSGSVYSIEQLTSPVRLVDFNLEVIL